MIVNSHPKIKLEVRLRLLFHFFVLRRSPRMTAIMQRYQQKGGHHRQLLHLD